MTPAARHRGWRTRTHSAMAPPQFSRAPTKSRSIFAFNGTSFHLVRGVTLKDRAGADPSSVTLQIAALPVRTNRLEIRPERTGRESGEPVLELLALLLEKRIAEHQPVERGLHLIHHNFTMRAAHTGNTFITSSPRWLMTLTAMRPDSGRSNGRETSLWSDAHASASISAFSVVLSAL